MSKRLLVALLLAVPQVGPRLPQPFHTPWFRKSTRVVAMPDGRQLIVPQGFTVGVYADRLQFARFMALSPNGDVFLAEPVRGDGRITILRDADGDGRAETRETFATGLNRPFGLAFWKNYLYVGNNDSLVRFTYRNGQTRAEGQAEKIADLPPSDAALDQDTANRLKIDLNQTRGYNHWTRNVIFNPAGTKLYVTIGSATNATPENEGAAVARAAIHEYNPDGSGRRLFASGLRNPVGLAYLPGTSTLWTAVNERDHLGDDLVPDYITSVRDGGFYGWPYSYIGQHVDPTVATPRPDLVAKAIVPDVLLASHAAALGLVFYTGSQFPAAYRGSAFVALHGSINRSKLSGYSVVRVPFRNGRPSGPPEAFLSGFIARDDEEKEAWGRPVGLLQLPDGSLLVSDDGGNRIWRVTYRDPRR
ncbi:MAG TPA: sorbosone dehydrogenase family protein [Vicinamibacterales bacterium]|nr:sorbosone dehydrogenase family protein [Vicinamibacterales bacterium]